MVLTMADAIFFGLVGIVQANQKDNHKRVSPDNVARVHVVDIGNKPTIGNLDTPYLVGATYRCLKELEVLRPVGGSSFIIVNHPDIRDAFQNRFDSRPYRGFTHLANLRISRSGTRSKMRCSCASDCLTPRLTIRCPFVPRRPIALAIKKAALSASLGGAIPFRTTHSLIGSMGGIRPGRRPFSTADE